MENTNIQAIIDNIKYDSLPMRYWTCTNESKLKKEIDNYIPLLKRDGAWYRGIVEINKQITLQSRTISKKTALPAEKQNNVPHIVEELQKLPNNTIVLGEICFLDSSKKSTDVTAIMNALPAKAIDRQSNNPLYYALFDVLMYNGEVVYTKPFKERLAILQQIFVDIKFEYIIPPQVGTVEDVETWLEQGEEGAVLMHKDSPYVTDMKSAKAWVSVKMKKRINVDLDGVVMGVTAPTKEYNGDNLLTWEYWENPMTGAKAAGNYYDKGYTPISKAYYHNWIGGLVVGAYYGDTLVEVCRLSNLTENLAALDETYWKGKVVKFSGMEVDKKKKSIRHPKFKGLHADKNANECLYEDIFGGK